MFGTALRAFAFRFDMHERGTVQITQRNRILRRIHDRTLGRLRIESTQYRKIAFIIAAHHHRFFGMLNMIDKSRTIVFLRAVMVEMIGFGVGDNGDFRMILGKAAIGFVRFRHKNVALTSMASVNRHTILALDGSADGIAWIGQISLTGMGEDMGQHGTGRGFAMSSCDRHRTFCVHQQCENVAAVHDAFACFVCCDDFRIVGFDGAGEYDGMFAFDVFCALPEFDGNADSLQTIGFGAGFTI